MVKFKAGDKVLIKDRYIKHIPQLKLEICETAYIVQISFGIATIKLDSGSIVLARVFWLEHAKHNFKLKGFIEDTN